MAFGSYDEAEQRQQNTSVEHDDGEREAIERHDGTVEFENKETDELLEIFHNEVET